ncbi:MAG: DUF1700 domain-containing protein [Eubacteriales bacterium]|nr:DUF1700 domain-containing protein [Eubacteriales bacterium]
MSQKEFLEELRIALSGRVSAESVLENIEYYRSYIEGEIQSGKSEKEVLDLLGDPWILARTISDAQDGTDDSIINESGSREYDNDGEDTERTNMQFRELKFPWWKIALIILAVIFGIVLIISIVTGLIRLLLPVLLPLLILCLIWQFFKKKH